ncbi:hypothetical protein QJQ45_006093 [Haematococcus lacustris]|nr:hypothetical protein QJQ45_006093 [Haematococcus lacustris]
MAERRAAEAEAKALALAAEAEAQALADAGAYEAQLHRLQTDLQLREQQLVDNQRLQTLQQHLQDLQRDELQRKEQQVAQQLAAVLQREQQLTEQQQQLQADLHLREQEVAEQQHQLQQQQADLHLREQQVAEQQQQADLHLREQQVAEQQQQADLHLREQQVAEQQQQADLHLREQQVAEQQQQADMHLREQQVAEQQHHLQQQHADMHLREQQVAEQRHMLQLQQQLNMLQQQLEARSGAVLQRQVQQQLAEQQHLLQQQQADLQVKQQQVEEQLQEAADQQAVSTNHPLPDHPPCSPHVPESLRSPLIKRPRQDTTVAPMPRYSIPMQSDGCASQFKGAKAIRLHWHLANKFGVPVQWSYGATSHFKSTHDSEGGVAKREWREQMLVHPELVGTVCGAVVLTDWANKHFAVPCHAQDTSTSHRQRGHIMFRRYLVLDDARQAMVCSMPEADVERMHDKVEGCRAMHRMVFTPDREQPQWAMAGCACSTCMSVPCLPCMKPDTTTPLEPMPMFQDTVKEVREDKECYALLMWFHPDLMHDEVCFGKLTNTHCARYRMYMGWKREETRRELRRLVLRDMRSEELEYEYEANG